MGLILMPGTVQPACFGQARLDTVKILFVGSSYAHFENLRQIISIISDSAKTKVITKKSTKGGARLSQHWLGKRGLKTKEMIQNGNFDFVVPQGHSMSAINEPDSLRKYSKLFCDFIKNNNSKPYFYMTWARERVPQFQQIITKVYSEFSKVNDASLVPVGKAWELALSKRPEINLFKSDGSHPSELSTFLTACVFIAKVLDEIPDKLNNLYKTTDIFGESIRLMALDPLDVVFCKEVAKELVIK